MSVADAANRLVQGGFAYGSAGNRVNWPDILTNATSGATYAESAEATYSGIEYDLAATAVTGGVVIESGYFAAGTGNTRQSFGVGLNAKLLMGKSYAGVSDTVTIATRGACGALSVNAVVDFSEVY
jgi:hypothetical protein